MSFMDTLRADAAKLAESELPAVEEVRGVLAALISRVADTVEGVNPAPATPDPAEVERQQKIADLQAQLAALEAGSDASPATQG